MLPYWHHGSTSLSDTSPEQGVFNAASDHANPDLFVAESFQVTINIELGHDNSQCLLLNLHFLAFLFFFLRSHSILRVLLGALSLFN